VIIVDSSAGAGDTLQHLLAANGATSVITWDRKAFAGWGIDWLWNGLGATEVVAGPANVRAVARTAEVGITTVDYALAETGTLVLFASPERARSVSLLPSIHVALVRASQIVAGSADVSQALEGLGADVPSSIHFITGPSRSADIENDLTIGVHGPAALIAIVALDA
jgi:L-lactate dehydrogenase complex protein LldG